MPKHTEDLKIVYKVIDDFMNILQNDGSLGKLPYELYTKAMAALGRIQESDKNSD